MIRGSSEPQLDMDAEMEDEVASMVSSLQEQLRIQESWLTICVA